MKDNHKAVVLGMSPTGLSAIRSLGRAGVEVIGMDYLRNQPGFWSKYCLPNLCPHPIEESERLLQHLKDLGSRLDAKAVLYPTSDEFVAFLCQYQDTLKENYLFTIPSKDKSELLINKQTQYETAGKVGICYPQTYWAESMEGLAEMSHKMTFPIILKPCYTYKWGKNQTKFKVKILFSKEDLIRFAKQYNPNTANKFMLQSVVNGPDTNHYEVCCYFNQQNRLLATFTKRKVRQYPNGFGVGSFVESCFNQEAEELAKKYFDYIHYAGIGEIEFKRDSKDKKFKFIEMNARLMTQNSLASYCGIDLTLIQYNDLTGGSFATPGSYKSGIKWLWLENDFSSYLGKKESDKPTFIKWIGQIMSAKSYAYFAWDDLKPCLKDIKYGLKILRRIYYLILKGRQR